MNRRWLPATAVSSSSRASSTWSVSFPNPAGLHWQKAISGLQRLAGLVDGRLIVQTDGTPSAWKRPAGKECGVIPPFPPAGPPPVRRPPGGLLYVTTAAVAGEKDPPAHPGLGRSGDRPRKETLSARNAPGPTAPGPPVRGRGTAVGLCRQEERLGPDPRRTGPQRDRPCRATVSRRNGKAGPVPSLDRWVGRGSRASRAGPCSTARNTCPADGPGARVPRANSMSSVRRRRSSSAGISMFPPRTNRVCGCAWPARPRSRTFSRRHRWQRVGAASDCFADTRGSWKGWEVDLRLTRESGPGSCCVIRPRDADPTCSFWGKIELVE